ncbi:MAG: ABC transporter substrate-binding protein [Actinomycetota bacterium]|nr:ABC transporter substrate-binding protein [Actinomycetota bacterium]
MGHSIAPTRRRKGRLLAALVISISVTAAACGGDDNGKSSDTTGAPETTVSGDTTAPPTSAAAEEPVPGGKLVMAVEADTSSPWRPAEMLCAVACHQIIRNIYDTLTMPNADGSWSPYLAESLTPNADFTEWTITARAGVTFHDGTPFDGAAIADNITRAKDGITTGAILRSLTSATVDPSDPMSAIVKVQLPWAAFPFAMMGQAGYQASPTWLTASDADPTLKSKPVGTGPFVYEDYVPGIAATFSMTKNADYWNQPYPYLDAIEFRAIPDALSRRDALLSGTVDILHSSNGQTIVDAREDTDNKLTEIAQNGETAYTLLHVTQEGSPLQDQNVRCALAWATDEQALIDAIGAGVGQQATGPFSPTQVGYLEDTGFPMTQDMAKAQELIAAYKADHPGNLTLSLATTQDNTNLVTAQQQQAWWQEAGFDEVTIDQIDQAQYILTAALGKFQVFQWRNHGGFDLDQQYYWWHSSSSSPVGSLGLNFGRIKDDTLDALLEENRASDDPARKKEIAEEVNRLFGEQCYNIWGSWTIWGIMSKPSVHGPVAFELPDGKESQFGAGFSGTFYAMNVWVDQ